MGASASRDLLVARARLRRLLVDLGVPVGTVERFSAKFTVSASGCWTWVGSAGPRGHPRFHAAGREWQSRRWLWVTVWGEPPAGTRVVATCGDRACVNPAHLGCVGHGQAIRRGKGDRCRKGHPYPPQPFGGSRDRPRRCALCQASRARSRARRQSRPRARAHAAEVRRRARAAGRP